MTRYDLAVIGAGLAGLSALYHLQVAGKLTGQRVVLVDPVVKHGNDRTWSFWEKEAGLFEDIVYHRWERVALHNAVHELTCDLSPYTYKLIRSADFYRKVMTTLETVEGLDIRRAAATDLASDAGEVRFTVAGERIVADRALSSLPFPLDYRAVDEPYLDQHFHGWYVETEEDVFSPGVATFMDFRTDQAGETRFLYVLPFSSRRAVVEVAIFGNEHLTTEAYETILSDYIKRHWTRGGYRIEHTEAGVIPMTTFPYPRRAGRLLHIGMAGGDTRPSTGYTFYNVQRQMAKLAAAYPELPALPSWPKRHILYDATLLRILQEGRLAGQDLFVDLFRKNPPARVLAFLNGETSLRQELALMSTVPLAPFAVTFGREALR